MTRPMILSLAAALLAAALFLAGCGDDGPTSASDNSDPAGWEKSYGGPGMESGLSVKQTTDDGYIITGWSRAPESDKEDILLLKTDELGDTMWAKTIAAPNGAVGKSVLQTPDGGYLILADYSPLGSNREFWIIKTDADGNMEWNQWKGYNDRKEEPSEMRPTSDGGYILVGTTDRGGHDLDIWLVKIYANGNTNWYTEKGYDSENEIGVSVQQTEDGGFLIAAVTTECTSYSCIWLVKTYADGSTHWYKTVDTVEPAAPVSIQKTNDGAYVLMAEVWGSGKHLIYLFKYDESGNELWRESNDVPGHYYGGEVQQTADGQFMIAGSTETSGLLDFCLIKLDSTGNTVLTKTFDSAYDWCFSGGQTTDGGYILCGFTKQLGDDWSTDVFLVKTDADGNVE